MLDFSGLKKKLKKSVVGFKRVKLSILGDSATQFIADAIRGMGIENALDIVVFEADFNQIDRQVLAMDSDLYQFNADIVLIFESTHKLLQKYNKQISERARFAENTIAHVQQLIHTLQNNTSAKIIFCNYTEENDSVFGQYANKVETSFLFQHRKLNFLLQELATHTNNLYICDLSSIQNTIGKNHFWSPSIYVHTEMVISIDALPYFAHSVVQIIAALQGIFKKCIILDLDNTVWGGVIGDDGIENIQIGQLGIGKAFTEFQYWIKKLQQRGIIIAVCSKNTESVAKEPFEKHPDMILKLSDIAVFIANWESKVDNICKIQKILNIGFDSMVFLDDNPFERNIVKENIPEITVPELPEDPALYLDYLYSLNLFETTSYSDEDAQRTAQYQKETARVVFQKSFTNRDDFLKSLNMCSDTKPFNDFIIPRVAQLSQRSNQFNLRTVRYTENDLKQIMHSDKYFTLSFTLEDKFGDNGLVCAIILEKQPNQTLFINTWLMSCRVLERGMETYVLNAIVNTAQKNGYTTLLGEYIPTKKNALVKDHYKNLGFTQTGNLWQLLLKYYEEKYNFITKKIN
ncbi:MAG: HAD-IIIC family phosphatase [Dysgonamonadaceae bacterium]|jgi:FkbH-like protein|nr:HAD-IIIC family phosphatase [Dysgonamonadaceae bacterium]